MEQYKCKGCGANIDNSKKECSYCGTSYYFEEKSTPIQATQETPASIEIPKNIINNTGMESPVRSIFANIILFVVCWPIGIIFFLIRMFSKNNK